MLPVIECQGIPGLFALREKPEIVCNLEETRKEHHCKQQVRPILPQAVAMYANLTE